jgi:hypothetical protein
MSAVQKLSYVVPINVREERLNQLSDLAIGEAMGGDLGRVVAEGARRNLAVLDEIDPPLIVNVEDDGSTQVVEMVS